MEKPNEGSSHQSLADAKYLADAERLAHAKSVAQLEEERLKKADLGFSVKRNEELEKYVEKIIPEFFPQTGRAPDTKENIPEPVLEDVSPFKKKEGSQPEPRIKVPEQRTSRSDF